MIQPQDLRIGNILGDKLTGALLRIDKLTIEGEIETYVLDRSKYPLPSGWELEPISLTPEILEMCGFYKEGFAEIYETTNFALHYNEQVGDFRYRKVDGSAVSVTTLHQLQNLYYILVGEELTINL